MRKEKDGSRPDPNTAFSLNRLNNINNYETGLRILGFDYSIKKERKEFFNLSVAQIINEKENKKMASISSLSEKVSDLVGSTNYKLNQNFELNYTSDQNYNELNYSEIGARIELNPIKLNSILLKSPNI